MSLQDSRPVKDEKGWYFNLDTAFMTLSRRSFVSGLAGLLGLLAWPWRSTPPEDVREPAPGEFFQGRLIINGEPVQEITYGPDSDIVKLLNEPNMKRQTPLPEMHWRDLSAPTPGEWARMVEDGFFSVDMDAQPTHFKGITKRYS